MNAVTPTQARDHWCPFARVDDRGVPPHRATTTCIAQKCMAWRWAQVVQLRNRATPETGLVEPPRPADIPETWVWYPPDEEECLPGMWIEPEAEAAERALGYCALAGDPAQRQAMADLTEAVGRLEHATRMQAISIAGRHA